MNKSRSKSSIKKSRQEIEAESTEKRYFDNNNNISQHYEATLGYGNFPFPAVYLPEIPLMDFDKYAYQNDNLHMTKKKGDIPLENFESEKSIHEDIHIENDSPTLGVKEKEKMLVSEKLNIASEKFNPIEIYWENITIIATVKQRKIRFLPCCHNKWSKVILDQCTGIAKPGSFTAILGPSGCGKTTLLNFLSGRMVSDNLEITGAMKINGIEAQNIDLIGNQIAYVMQDDILLATFTPREAFTFTANLRLKLSKVEIKKKVETLLRDLGLQECADTKIGNNLIRGISGGERKRTSIGVELLTNPSLIFLDEPTTGLDSATSFHVVNILKKLAKSGRTIISTIHQPSSEIFGTFDKLLLMVQGNIIYQGNAAQAIDYFAGIGLKAPPFSNPSTFFMKCMNPEGLLVENMQKTKNYDIALTNEIKVDFKERVAKMLKNYKESSYFTEIKPSSDLEIPHDESLNTVSWLTQYLLVTKRGFLNEIRNPMDLRTRYFSTIVFSFICCIVFEGLGSYYRGVQNRMGCIFFFIMGCSFSPVMHSILTFSSEKPLFLREILNRSYSVSAYYWGKTSSEFPFHLSYPIIMAAIIYYIVGLDDSDNSKIFILMGIGMVTFFSGVSYGLFISVLFPKPEMAMSLVPVIIVPFMLFGGFFVSQNNIPYYFYPFEYLSMFKYGFQAAVENEFQGQVYYWDETRKKVYDPVATQNFGENIWESCLIQLSVGVAFRILTYVIMNAVSAPKRPKLNRLDNK